MVWWRGDGRCSHQRGGSGAEAGAEAPRRGALHGARHSARYGARPRPFALRAPRSRKLFESPLEALAMPDAWKRCVGCARVG